MSPTPMEVWKHGGHCKEDPNCKKKPTQHRYNTLRHRAAISSLLSPVKTFQGLTSHIPLPLGLPSMTCLLLRHFYLFEGLQAESASAPVPCQCLCCCLPCLPQGLLPGQFLPIKYAALPDFLRSFPPAPPPDSHPSRILFITCVYSHVHVCMCMSVHAQACEGTHVNMYT